VTTALIGDVDDPQEDDEIDYFSGSN